jgi:predicted protein tyrosine phosphatase
MTDPIRAALDKAAEAVRVSFIKDGSCYGGDACHTLPCKCASDASSHAIAAFLRALPDDADLVLPSLGPIGRAFPVATLAQAVLAAAKDQPND